MLLTPISESTTGFELGNAGLYGANAGLANRTNTTNSATPQRGLNFRSNGQIVNQQQYIQICKPTPVSTQVSKGHYIKTLLYKRKNDECYDEFKAIFKSSNFTIFVKLSNDYKKKKLQPKHFYLLVLILLATSKKKINQQLFQIILIYLKKI